MAKAITVPFHGSNLFVVEHNGQPFTPMKPIVEGMGLDWRSQQRKLSSNTRRWGMVKMTMQLAGDHQGREVLNMPLRKLFGWLQTISPNKVKASIRDKVIQYQNECDDVLWQYWSDKVKPAQPEPLALPTHKPSRKVTLNQLIFELANLRGISPQDVRIHYSQIFNGPAWETDEFTLALACVKLRNDIAEELKQTQPEMKHLNDLAAEQGMKLVSESEYNFMKYRLTQQQSAIEELHQAVLVLSKQSQQLINEPFWG